jgi:hypothetical protein
MKLDDCVKLHLEVGEGTNESIDLDKFDQYYHLFLWTMISAEHIEWDAETKFKKL